MTKPFALSFVGQRRRDFTVTGDVTGYPYYVQPESGKSVWFDTDDGKALLERDPHLWKPSYPAATAEALRQAAGKVEEDTDTEKETPPRKPASNKKSQG